MLESTDSEVFKINVFPVSDPGPSVRLRTVSDPKLSNSIISRTHAEAINGRILPYARFIVLEDCFGNAYEATGSIDVLWHRSDRLKRFRSTFSVVNVIISQNFDIILGAQETTRVLESELDKSNVRVLTLSRLTTGKWARSIPFLFSCSSLV